MPHLAATDKGVYVGTQSAWLAYGKKAIQQQKQQKDRFFHGVRVICKVRKIGRKTVKKFGRKVVMPVDFYFLHIVYSSRFM